MSKSSSGSAETPTTLALGTTTVTLLKRSLAVFAFWGIVVFLLLVMYNELVCSPMVCQYTVEGGAKVPEDNEMIAPEMEEYRLDYHQMVTIALSAGLMSVAVRLALEAICSFGSAGACSILTGIPAAASSDTSAAVEGEPSYVTEGDAQPPAYDDGAPAGPRYPPPPERMQNDRYPASTLASERQPVPQPQRRVRFEE